MTPVTAPAGAGSPPVFRDGFGARWVAPDPDGGDPAEVLSFAREFVQAPDFAAAVGERVARLALARHSLYARVRRLDRPVPDALFLYSDHMPGWRLADALQIAQRERLVLEIGSILVLMRQLIPTVAMFSRHHRDAAIGTLAPERLILTPENRLVLAEYVLAPGLERLHISRERLWREFRVVMPTWANPSQIPPAADVVGMGIVALSLLLGRAIGEEEYLALGDLVESATETIAGTTRRLSEGFASWVARALQFGDSGFKSPHEAQVAFEEMLGRERAYTTSASQLELFVARLEKASPLPPPPAKHPSGARPAAGSGSRVAVTPLATPPGASAIATAPSPPAHATPSALESPPPVEPTRPSLSAAEPASERQPASARVASGGWTRFLLALLGGIVAVETVWLVTGPSTQPGPLAQGSLGVQSRPVAARVSVDGEDRGITPLSLDLTTGAHVLEVRVGRSEPRVIPIDIRAGVRSELYVELQSVATVGGLDIRTEPSSAKVTVNGQFRGTTPLVLRDLPPGDLEVLLESGKRQVRQRVRIEPGITGHLIVPLGGQ
ncbi:MAG: PEGA domain-containing protein [Acidobacteriota bacterium]